MSVVLFEAQEGPLETGDVKKNSPQTVAFSEFMFIFASLPQKSVLC